MTTGEHDWPVGSHPRLPSQKKKSRATPRALLQRPSSGPMLVTSLIISQMLM
jgi:hypothetical protein